MRWMTRQATSGRPCHRDRVRFEAHTQGGAQGVVGQAPRALHQLLG
jgi:hypothetical protein